MSYSSNLNFQLALLPEIDAFATWIPMIRRAIRFQQVRFYRCFPRVSPDVPRAWRPLRLLGCDVKVAVRH